MQPYDPNWPWYPLELGSVTDLVSIILGLIILGISVWIALRQIRIMHRQTAMMVEQGEIAKRQESISQRQGTIAEAQHQILEEQRAKVAILELNLYLTDEETVFLLGIKNTGKATARDFYWRLFMPPAWDDKVKFVKQEHQLLDFEPVSYDKINLYLRTGGLVSVPTYPGRVTVVAKLIVDKWLVYEEFDGPSDHRFRWYINAESGRFPAGKLYGEADFQSPEGRTPQSLELDEPQ